MNTLYIYNDLSQDIAHSFGFIQSKSKDLIKQNIFIPSIHFCPATSLKDHSVIISQIANIYSANKEFNTIQQNWINELSEAAKKNQDIIIYYRSLEESSLKFIDFLKDQSSLDKYTFKYLLVITHPLCFFEHQAILYKNIYPATDYQKNLETSLTLLSNALSVLVPSIEKKLSKNNLSIYFDDSIYPYSAKLSDAHKDVLKEFGLENIDEDLTPIHILTLKSQIAREIFLKHLRVGDNIWPPLKENEVFTSLKRIEDQNLWDQSSLIDPFLRQKFLDLIPDSIDFINKTLNLDIKSTSCSKNLLPDSEWNKDPEISDKILEDFVHGLPKTLSNILHRRFAIDHVMLNPIQERLFTILNNLDGKNIQILKSKSTPLLSVLTMTYNHHDYIGKCIESVLSQKTNFQIQHIIIDDCSTDGTQEVIKKYAQKYPSIRPVLLGNKSRNGSNVLGLFQRCRTEFASLCDGDDYFTDTRKLQIQVDFLNEHKECALCFHPVNVVYEDGTPTRVYPPENCLPGGVRLFYTLKDLLYCNLIQTNSVVYRWRFKDGLPDWFVPNLCPGDWFWHMLHAEIGLIGYIRKRMSVYRRHKRALYIRTETDQVEHRKFFGLAELRMYYIADKHFKGRYHLDFCNHAQAVFTSFLSIFAKTGDDTLLKRASERYPEFANYFYSQIEII